MKRILTLCVASALVSTSAFASLARQQVLGTLNPLGTESGSFLIEDNMNMFYNPAYINDFKNWAAVEKNAVGSAEGGFVSTLGPVNVGVYFNRSGATNSFLTPSPYSNVAAGEAPMRPFDITIGGDMGWKWGIAFTYGQNTNSVAATQGTTEWGLKGGVSVMDFEPFVIWQSGKDKNPALSGTGTNPTMEDKGSKLTFGARYHYGEWAPFAMYRMDASERTGNTTTTQNFEQKAEAWGFGVARTMKIADATTLNYGMAWWHRSAGTTFGTLTRTTDKRLPVSISVEGEAASWLVLRAGLNYNLVATSNDVSVNTTATQGTTGRFGAGFKLGKAMLDWSVGNATGGVDSATFGFDGSFFTTASLTYMW